MQPNTPLHPVNEGSRGTRGPNSGVPQQGKKPFWGLSAFNIFHTKRTNIEKLGKQGDYQLTWERKELPGAGAQQYAFETYGLPMYPQYGRGNTCVTNPLRETFPAMYAFQAVSVVGIPPKGILQGQFVTQPLMDPNSAVAAGIVAAGAVPNGPNAIVNGAPVLGP